VLKNETEGSDGEVEMSLLVRTIEARLSEILDAVRYIIEQSGYAGKISSGVVITGGASHHEDLIQLATALLGQKIRLSAPASIDKNSVEDAFDVYAATAVGLVQETLDPMLSHAIEHKQETIAQGAVKTPEVTLFEDEPEEEPQERLSDRELRRLEKEREKEARRREKEEKKKEKEKAPKGPTFFDMLFSDNDNA